MTYVDDNSLAEVMIMRYWMEVMLTRVLRILMDPLLFIPRDFRQWPETGNKISFIKFALYLCPCGKEVYFG